MSRPGPRTIGVVTFSRAEYSACRPVIEAIQAEDDLALHLLVSGTHLAAEFGSTIEAIEADGFVIADRIEMLDPNDTPAGTGRSIGRAVIGLAESFARSRPDILLLAGDRLELLAVAAAAYPFGLPLAHLSGGEITQGAYDDQVRHALTKLSHLHFVAHEQASRRLIQMGEEGWRVHTTGEPALDLIGRTELMERRELARFLGMDLSPPVVVVTQHPTTLSGQVATIEVDQLLATLDCLAATIIFTSPNADPGGRAIAKRLQDFASTRPRAAFFASLGQRRYWSLLAIADLMVGNSSSGIWEAPSFELPAVNIGRRQDGRLRAANVIDAAPESKAILAAIERGLDPAFKASLAGLVNPYGDGSAALCIVGVLKQLELGMKLLQKRFVDRPEVSLLDP
ncbi:MAG: UDP-N-acetylglucosamine 2-epimerase (hydrolyzing) [Deltaproteobacteria bacterium]|nr:UDP-N-acetylglucosamine 2-epimerase (hydrolyzing) [Deltaproteobacteria bacterium]